MVLMTVAIYVTISVSMVCLVVLAITATTLMVIMSPVKVNVLCALSPCLH